MDPGQLDKHEECRTLKDCKSKETLVIFGIPKILESFGSLENLETLGPLWNPRNPGEPSGTHGSPEPAEPSEPSEKAGTLWHMRLFAQCIRVTQSLLLHKNP